MHQERSIVGLWQRGLENGATGIGAVRLRQSFDESGILARRVEFHCRQSACLTWELYRSYELQGRTLCQMCRHRDGAVEDQRIMGCWALQNGVKM